MVSQEIRDKLNIEYDAGAKMYELVKKYNLTLVTVQKYIKRPRSTGLPKGARSKVTKEMEQEFKRLYDDDRSMYYIAKKFNVSNQTVNNHLKAAWQQ